MHVLTLLPFDRLQKLHARILSPATDGPRHAAKHVSGLGLGCNIGAAPAWGRSAHDLRQRGSAGGAAAGARRRCQRAEGCQERPRLCIAARVAKRLHACSSSVHVPRQPAHCKQSCRGHPIVIASAAHGAPAGSDRRDSACIAQSAAPTPGSCPSSQPRQPLRQQIT